MLPSYSEQVNSNFIELILKNSSKKSNNINFININD